MASQLKPFTPNVITKDPLLPLYRVETTFLEASRKSLGTVSKKIMKLQALHEEIIWKKRSE